MKKQTKKSHVRANVKSNLINQPKLNLACGKNKAEGFFGVDKVMIPGLVDAVVDLMYFPWNIKSESTDEIICSHYVEHIPKTTMLNGLSIALKKNPTYAGFRNELLRYLNIVPDDGLIAFMEELYRIMKFGSVAKIICPYWSSIRCWQDPTHCYSDDTEVLTKTGFKYIKDIELDEEVWTLNKENGINELQPVIDVIDEYYEGDMISFKSNNVDLLVTPNHDLLYKTIGTNKKTDEWNIIRADSFFDLQKPSRYGSSLFTGKLQEKDYIEIPYVERSGNKGPESNLPKIDIEDYCKFLGWFLSEGSISRTKKGDTGSYRITIHQSFSINKEKCDIIEQLLNKIGFHYTKEKDRFNIYNKSLYYYLKPLGNSYTKYIPEEIKNLDKKYLDKLLETLILGDGRINGNGYEYASVSKRLIDDVQEIAIKCGNRSTCYVEKRGYLKYIAKSKKQSYCKDIYLVSIYKNTNIYYPKPKIEKYVGNIVCVTVPKNNIILIRRNGKVIWSGNCRAINEATFLYFNRAWRVANGLDHYGIHCDFDYSYGYDLSQELLTKSQETRDFAIKNYTNSVMDIQFILTKRIEEKK
jgi:hypothetical protein